MIEEIVPFSETLSTIFVVAFEYLDIPLGFRILKGEDSELLSLRDVLLYLDRFEVESSPSLHMNFDIICDPVEMFTVSEVGYFQLIFRFTEETCLGSIVFEEVLADFVLALMLRSNRRLTFLRSTADTERRDLGFVKYSYSLGIPFFGCLR